MASISLTLARIKQDLGHYLTESEIVEACRAAGHRWRERKLGPVATIHLFILQILSFNAAIVHLRHLAGQSLNAAAYCKARMRLPLAAVQQLLRDGSTAMRQTLSPGSDPAGWWCGLRAYLLDGSSTITPDTPALQKAFGQPKGQKKGCGFPVPKLLGLFDAFTGMVVEMLGFPLYTHDQSKAWQLHPLLGAGDLLVADCGLCSFVHLAMLSARNVMACFRCHQRQIVNFRPYRKSRDKAAKGHKTGKPTSTFVRRLGKHDQIVRWKRPLSRPAWISDQQWEAMPQWLDVRELRYTLEHKGQRTHVVTIATTLLDPDKYPKEKIVELYGTRWHVETHFGQLKTTLKMRTIKSQTEDGARKELAIYCLVYNLVHAVMLQAAQRQGVTPDRISFIDAVRWLLSASPETALPDLVVNPSRPDRHEPRVKKDRHKSYPYMTRPRKELQKALKKKPKVLK
jgi:hypothetical protein